ncbi:MAG: recombination-associated protein RdgC [Candidatus Sumerlaeaceae bacterium]|jgi:recombination associated protein RdgC
MGLINGSVTYRKFRVADSLPKGFHEKLLMGLQRHAFREIDPKNNPEQSIGWVNPSDPFDADLTLDKVLVGDWLLLGMRWDRKTVPSLLLKSRIAEKIRASLAERRQRKLSREEVQQIRQGVKEALLATVAPTTAVYEALWNLKTGIVFFSAHATRVVDHFVDLFEDTTGLGLDELTLVSRTEDFCDRTALECDFEALEETNFVTTR